MLIDEIEAECEKAKHQAYAICFNAKLPIEDRAEAYVKVLIAQYVRSFRAYPRNHVSFSVYISMRLLDSDHILHAGEEVYRFLVNYYGINAGIEPGSSYYKGE